MNPFFFKYIHTFLKDKQEDSGYPSKATEQESREKYIRDYQVNQGIRLDVNKIKVNPAKRQVSTWKVLIQRWGSLGLYFMRLIEP